MPCTWQGCSAISSIAVVVLSDTAMTRMDLPEPTASEMIVPQHPPGSLPPKTPTWVMGASNTVTETVGASAPPRQYQLCIPADCFAPHGIIPSISSSRGRCASIHRTASSKLIPGRSKLIDSAPMCVGLVATPGTKIPYMPESCVSGVARRDEGALEVDGAGIVGASLDPHPTTSDAQTKTSAEA